MFVVAMVVCADLLRDDTGLITGLVIGAILVNRPPSGVEPHGADDPAAKLPRSWRERIATVSTFLIGVLFIILSARVSPDSDRRDRLGEHRVRRRARVASAGRSPSGFRPSARRWTDARACVRRLDGTPRDRRGRDVVDVCARPQPGRGRGGAQDLIPITFIVIVATGLIYGVSGGAVRARSASRRTGPGGVLLIGCSPVGTRHRTCAPGPRDYRAGVDGGRRVRRAAKPTGSRVQRRSHARTRRTTPPPSSTSSSTRSPLLRTRLSTRWSRPTSPSTSAATASSSSRSRTTGPADFYTRATILFDDSATHEALVAQIKAGGEIPSPRRRRTGR